MPASERSVSSAPLPPARTARPLPCGGLPSSLRRPHSACAGRPCETSTNRHRCGRPPAQRSSSARASAASARARSRSHCDRQSRGACSGTDTGDNRTPPLPSTSVKPVPKSSSRTTMRTTIAHGKSRYQQKDSTLWGLASTWEMRLTGPIPRPERTLTREPRRPHVTVWGADRLGGCRAGNGRMSAPRRVAVARRTQAGDCRTLPLLRLPQLIELLKAQQSGRSLVLHRALDLAVDLP